MVTKFLADQMGSVFRVHVDGGGEDGFFLFKDRNGHVKGLIPKAFRDAVHRNAATLEVEIAEGAVQVLVQNRGQKIAFELLGNNAAFFGNIIKLSISIYSNFKSSSAL